MIVSDLLFTEIDDVFARPTLLSKLSTLPGRDVDAVRRRLASGTVVRILTIEPVSRDPDDDYLIAMAIAGRASFLVTEDYDLLTICSYKGTAFIEGRHFLRMLDAIDRGDS